jgi:hypothetical protein
MVIFRFGEYHILKSQTPCYMSLRLVPDNSNELCFTAPLGGVVGGIVTFSKCIFSSGLPESPQQNLTFGAGSSSFGKGAPGAITVGLTGAPCLDVVTQTANDTSEDYVGIRPCIG